MLKTLFGNEMTTTIRYRDLMRQIKRIIFAVLIIFTIVFIYFLIRKYYLQEKIKEIKIETLHINEPPELKTIKQFIDYIETPQQRCCNPRTFGGIPKTAEKAQWFGGILNELLNIHNDLHYTDGDKVICFDDPWKLDPSNCVVYSFGINDEWSFDDGVAEFGCSVYAFDPSIDSQSYKRGRNILFYPIGVGGSPRLYQESEKQSYRKNKIMRLTKIVDMLGHQTSPKFIDYLKLDIEGEEIYVLLDILYKNPEILSKFKQIGMEIHPGIYSKENFHVFQAYFQYFKELELQNFRLLHSSMNSVPGNKYILSDYNIVTNGYYELVWGQILTH